MGRGWRLTVRQGSQVERESFTSAEEALAALRRSAIKVLAKGPVREIDSLRTFSPAQQVAARLEISAPSRIRLREAGMDVKGDGRLVPYTGAIRKEPIDLTAGQDPYEALREALRSLS
ncbi:MAG: hypothetical protein ABR536_06660 [Solirubrobacterales bacterium]